MRVTRNPDEWLSELVVAGDFPITPFPANRLSQEHGLPVPPVYCGGSARRIKAANRGSERMGSYTGETLIQESW